MDYICQQSGGRPSRRAQRSVSAARRVDRGTRRCGTVSGPHTLRRHRTGPAAAPAGQGLGWPPARPGPPPHHQQPPHPPDRLLTRAVLPHLRHPSPHPPKLLQSHRCTVCPRFVAAPPPPLTARLCPDMRLTRRAAAAGAPAHLPPTATAVPATGAPPSPGARCAAELATRSGCRHMPPPSAVPAPGVGGGVGGP